MDEHEFAVLLQRPFGMEDLQRADTQWGRSATLASALFGRAPEELRRQLVASHPEVPSGFDLADFPDLERQVQTISGLVFRRFEQSTNGVAVSLADAVRVGHRHG